MCVDCAAEARKTLSQSFVWMCRQIHLCCRMLCGVIQFYCAHMCVAEARFSWLHFPWGRGPCFLFLCARVHVRQNSAEAMNPLSRFLRRRLRRHATLRLIACARAHMCSAKVFVVMLSHAAACADSLMVCEQQPVCCKDFFRLASSDKHVFFTREKPREPTSTVCGVCLICVNDCTHVCGSELWSP